jgi:hypothetical protein
LVPLQQEEELELACLEAERLAEEEAIFVLLKKRTMQKPMLG